VGKKQQKQSLDKKLLTARMKKHSLKKKKMEMELGVDESWTKNEEEGGIGVALTINPSLQRIFFPL
jgi:hypothetical protein